MKPTIKVCILSKDTPLLGIETINLLKTAAFNSQSVSFSLIINDDQTDLYEPEIKDMPMVSLGSVSSTQKGLRKCFIKSIEIFLEEKEDFLFILPHDIFGVVNRWDKFINEKIGFFPDNIMSLYSLQDGFARSQQVLESCYCISYDDSVMPQRPLRTLQREFGQLDCNDSLNIDFAVAFEFCDLFPCITSKLAEYLLEFYYNESGDLSHDLIVAMLLQQVFRMTGENRNIFGLPDSFRAVNDGNTHRKIQESRIDLSNLTKIANKMSNDIIREKWKTWQQKII
ncbi:MAG: hypothetical protein SGJ02_09805 [bacterium]|nr:hypothetical protein [bacterium]